MLQKVIMVVYRKVKHKFRIEIILRAVFKSAQSYVQNNNPNPK